METLYSVAEIAAAVGCSKKWVQRLAPELIDAGLAQKVGKVLVLDWKAASYIDRRPDRRGRPKKEAAKC